MSELPVHTTSSAELETRFVGREGLVESLMEVYDGGTRTLTLTGPPGMGKTRVAREFVRAHEARREGDVWFLDVEELDEPGEIVSLMAERLSIPFDVDDGIDRTAHSLAGRDGAMVVLDDAEHLVDRGLDDLLREWLQRAEHLKFLVTSRTRVGAEFEVCRALEPLSVEAAVELFEARARRVEPGFEIDDANRSAVADLVDRLDRLPLAIKLAAGRIRVLSPTQMLERLEQPFELLEGAGGTSEFRSLRRAIETSWESLSEPERRALAQCSVFRETFSMKAAEAVVDGGPEAPPILQVISSLVDRSLLQTTREQSVGGRVRLRMLASIRNFAAERLDEREARRATERRHADYFLDHARVWRGHRFDPEFLDWIPGVRPDVENFEAALDFVLPERPEAAAEICSTLGDFFLYRQNRSKVSAHVDRVLEEIDPAEQSVLHAKLLHLKAYAVDAGEKTRRTQRLRRRALSKLEGLDAPKLRCNLLVTLGFSEFVLGYYEKTGPFFEEALAIAEREGYELEKSAVLSIWGRQKCEEGELQTAETYLQRALRTVEGLDAAYQESRVRINFGALLHRWNRAEETLEQVERGMELVQRDGVPLQGTTEHANLACARALVREFEAADERFEKAVGVLQRRGLRKAQANTLLDHGLVLIEIREFERAREKLEEAKFLSGPDNRAGSFSNLGGARASLGVIHAHEGDLDRAGTAFEGAEALIEDAPSEYTAQKLERFIDVQRLHADLVALQSGANTEVEPEELSERFGALSERPRESFEVKIAFRTVAEALEERIDGALSRGEPASSDARTGRLVVGPDARWIELDGEELDFSRRGPLRRLVLALVENHEDADASPLSTYELLDAGWPDQEISVEAGTNRVYTAVSRLRNLGFEEIIRTDDEGYFLEPGLEVRRE